MLPNEPDTDKKEADAPVIELEEIEGPSPAAPEDSKVTPEPPVPKRRRSKRAKAAATPKRRKKRLWIFSAVGSLILTITRFMIVTAILSGIIGYIGYKSLQTFIAGEEVRVPNVCGGDLQTCLLKLRENGLTLELDKREYSEEAAEGVVLRQVPAPDSTVKSRTPVRVTVSLGPSRQPLPNVIGLNKEEAGIKIRQNEFKLGKHSYAYDLRAERNFVIAQDPPRDALRPKDWRVNLLISLGPPPIEYEMPNLIGLMLIEARVKLNMMDLSISNVIDDDRAGVEQGIIIDQDPRPGQSVTSETPITLTQATGVDG